ncbi:hypothetical protein Ac2012v2_004672 [Leucoagaricus gongylophorus]
MSLPMLFNSGAECGPINPLQGLSKRFDQDRGIQQDHIGAPTAGSSRDAFRTQIGPSGSDADAGRFFNSTPTTLVGASRLETAFNVSAMRAALPSASAQPLQSQATAPTTGWAADFMRMDLGVAQQPKQQIQQIHSPAGPMQARSVDARTGVVHSPTPPLMQNRNTMGSGMHTFIPHTPIQQQAQASIPSLSDQLSWDKEFTAQEVQLASIIAEQTQQESGVTNKTQFEGDELAKTAGVLIENLKHETNPKFQNSQFMSLMKQFRDGEVVVSGNQVVQNDSTTKNSSQLDKGKGRVPGNLSPAEGANRPVMDLPMFRVQHQRDLSQMKEEDLEKEDANDAYFRQENAEYTNFWQEVEQLSPAQTLSLSSPEWRWDALQEDWDRFEATSSGIKQVDNYQFQDSNPYLLGDSSRTRHHAMHTGMSPSLESVLELEAAVQRDMTKARAWYELGVRQQENEREHQALQALKRAVELDPTHLPSWLACPSPMPMIITVKGPMTLLKNG